MTPGAPASVWTTQAARDRAEATWHALNQRLGLAVEPVTTHLLRARIEPNTARIVLRITPGDGPPLVYKQTLAGASPAQFRAEVEAHHHMMQLFEGQAPLHVPDLIQADPDNQALIMDMAPGMTAQDALVLAETGAARHEILQRCAGWMAFLHRQTATGTAPFDPERMILRGRRALTQLRQRIFDVPQRRRFVACARRALDLAEQARGQPTTHAILHGDMNLRNLMLAPNGVWGLDFSARQPGSIGQDLARLLVNYGTFFFPPRAWQDPGADWFREARTALFDAYGPEHGSDPATAALIGLQILNDWRTIPRAPDARNVMHDRRWKGVQLMARAFLEDGGA